MRRPPCRCLETPAGVLVGGHHPLSTSTTGNGAHLTTPPPVGAARAPPLEKALSLTRSISLGSLVMLHPLPLDPPAGPQGAQGRTAGAGAAPPGALLPGYGQGGVALGGVGEQQQPRHGLSSPGQALAAGDPWVGAGAHVSSFPPQLQASCLPHHSPQQHGAVLADEDDPLASPYAASWRAAPTVAAEPFSRVLPALPPLSPPRVSLGLARGPLQPGRPWGGAGGHVEGGVRRTPQRVTPAGGGARSPLQQPLLSSLGE